MSIISQMATAVNNKMAAVITDRNGKYEAAANAFVTDLQSYLDALEARDLALETAKGDFNSAADQAFVDAKARVNASISYLKSNVDGTTIDSLTEMFEEIERVSDSDDPNRDSVIEVLINTFVSTEATALNTVKTTVGNVDEMEAAFNAARA